MMVIKKLKFKGFYRFIYKVGTHLKGGNTVYAIFQRFHSCKEVLLKAWVIVNGVLVLINQIYESNMQNFYKMKEITVPIRNL